jgi:hypothetical protein
MRIQARLEVDGEYGPGKFQCPNCGAGFPALVGNCPACGYPLGEGEPVENASRTEALPELVENANQTLATAATRGAETAFGISCSLSLILIILVLVVLFFAATRKWTILAVVASIAGLAAVMLSAILATRARDATLSATYRRSVQPEIEAYLSTSGLTRPQFDALARQQLPEDAPLCQFLAQPPAPPDPTQED